MTTRLGLSCVLSLLTGCAQSGGLPRKNESAPGSIDDRELPPPDTQETLPAPPPSCPKTPQNLLANGDFEAGPGQGWREQSDLYQPVITSRGALSLAPQGGMYAVWMGGYYPEPGWQYAGDSLSQDVTVPAGERLQVLGYRHIETEETDGEYDTLQVTVRTINGDLLEVLKDPVVPSCARRDCTWSNQDATSGWAPFALSAARSYGGQVVRLQFESVIDDVLNTNFFLDTVSAHITVCP